MDLSSLRDNVCARSCTYTCVCIYMNVQSNLLNEYLEGHTKSVLLIRGTYYQYWLTYSVHELGTE